MGQDRFGPAGQRIRYMNVHSFMGFWRRRQPRITQAVYWILSISPLLVFWFPDFHTTFEEDVVLLAVFVYILLRACNRERVRLTDRWTPWVNTGLLSVIYSVGWFGLLRGYLDAWGQWCALYLVALLGTSLLYRSADPHPPLPYRWLIASILSGLVGLGMVAGILLMSIPHREGILSFLPYLLWSVIVAAVALQSNSLPNLDTTRNHVPLLLVSSFTVLTVWSGTIHTWVLWYQAGVEERAWIPSMIDDPEQIEEVELKPIHAANLYQQTKISILTKGDIPFYLNWPFFLDYRAAFQFMRKTKPDLCALILPPDSRVSPEKSVMIKELWNQEFLWKMQESEPSYRMEIGIWVDIEIDPVHKTTYTLDRWGRVYTIHNGSCWLEWEPETLVTDAVDLELIYGNQWIILCRSGRLLAPATIDIFPTMIEPLKPESEFIDIELFDSDSCGLAMNRYGEMVVLGLLPDDFPDITRLVFKEPVIVDFEIDPSQRGYYLLDQYGAVHSNHVDGPEAVIPHTSPPVAAELLPYWSGQAMAVDLEIDPLQRGLLVYNRLGEIFTIAVNPYQTTYRPSLSYPYRGIDLEIESDGTRTVLEANGAVIMVE